MKGYRDYVIEDVYVVLSKKEAWALNIASLSVIGDIDKNGYSVVVAAKHFASPVMEVELNPNSVNVKLNDNYDAEVSKDTIVVGCQTFPISILDDLIAAREKVS